MSEQKPGPAAAGPEKSPFPDLSGKTLKVALLGCGVVGTQVARLLAEQADDLAVRTGARLELAGIAVRRISTPGPASIRRC
jgi:homoserine dehydrogenase